METSRNDPELPELIRRYYALLYRYAYRLCGSSADAEDLTQQTFLTAQLKLEQVRDPRHVKAWLCTIVRNTYLKGLRSNNGAKLRSLENAPEPIAAISSETNFDSEELQSVLNELAEELRTPLILFYFEEFSYKEIAAQMGVPIGTVMSRLARGKMHLRRRLCSRSAATTPWIDGS